MSTTNAQADSAVALSWRIEESQGNKVVVEFFGEIDENAEFADLRRQLKGAVVFNLAEIRRINSCGVREWVNFVRELSDVQSLTFTHCSPAIVTQLNMIYNFRGNAKIRSFYAPYVCESCNNEEDKLLDVESQFPNSDIGTVPSFHCGECDELMEFDDIPERYLSFLSET
jgi:anti-anti-sigma regulatory factor